LIESQEVHNYASLWRDHTTYWRNRDQFIPLVLRDLTELSQMPVLGLRRGDAQLIEVAAARRTARVRWLARARWAIWLTAALVTIMRWEDLPALGAAVFAELPLLEKVLRSLGIGDLTNQEFAMSFLGREFVAIAVVLACAAVAYEITYLAWQVWTWWDTRALLHRFDSPSAVPRWTFFVIALGLIDAGLVISLGLPGTSVVNGLLNPGLAHLLPSILIPGFGAWGIMTAVRFFRRKLVTLGPGAVAALIVAPLMALLLTIRIGELYRTGIFLLLTVLACVLIHKIAAAADAERDRWSSALDDRSGDSAVAAGR
jgi:hypothetical protein